MILLKKILSYHNKINLANYYAKMLIKIKNHISYRKKDNQWKYRIQRYNKIFVI